MEKYDTIIVGAGPAGLRCAEILAQGGKKVLVLERNKVIGDKVCAGGLTLKDLELGIPDSIIQRKFSKIKITIEGKTDVIKLDRPFIATVNRKDLGRWMAEKARKAGAEIRKEANVTAIEEGSVVINDKERVEYKSLVGADGANSVVRRHLGLPNGNSLEAFQYIAPKRFSDLELFMDPKQFGPLYTWIFPYKNTTSIGGGGDITTEFKKPALGMPVSTIRKNFEGWCDEKIDKSKSKFQAYTINYDYRGHIFGNKFLIGDAGGFASGLTGEGMYYAIKSGEDVAKRILDKHYETVNINHMLSIKRIEKILLRILEINLSWTEVEYKLLRMLLKNNWVDKKFIEFLD